MFQDGAGFGYILRKITVKIKEIAVDVNGRRVIFYGFFIIFFRFGVVFEIVSVKLAEVVERSGILRPNNADVFLNFFGAFVIAYHLAIHSQHQPVFQIIAVFF